MCTELIFRVSFQVVTGGHYDVDVILTGPRKNEIYKEVKKQYDSHTFTADQERSDLSVLSLYTTARSWISPIVD
jgi:hypothetical protein